MTVIIVNFRIFKATVNTHVPAKVGENRPTGCWEKGILNRRDERTDRHTIGFYSIESVLCDQSSWFFGFIKPLPLHTFLPELVWIGQAVGEKWTTEKFEKPTVSTFYNIEFEPCNRSSWFFTLIRPLSVPTFVPNYVKLSSVVAEK